MNFSDIDAIEKPQLVELSDRLLNPDSDVIECSISFIEAESYQIWHGRARAVMCRRLKYCSLSDQQKKRLIAVILKRLQTGMFAEQFKDQLRLALFLDRERVQAVARLCLESPIHHVRRYGEWILKRNPSILHLRPEQEAELDRRILEVERNPGVGTPAEIVFARLKPKKTMN